MTGIQTESIGKKTTKVDISDIGKSRLNNATELTIAAGAITVTQSYHVIDTESDAATDDLTTINGGAGGQILIIRPYSSARTVVVKHGAAANSIFCGTDFSMGSNGDMMMLLFDAPSNLWIELSRSDNGT